VGLAGLLAGLLVVFGMRSLIRRQWLAGSIVVERENRHDDIDLSRFKGRAVLGSAGDIRLDGDGIQPKHAVIALEKSGAGERVQVLRGIQGPVAVERRGCRMGVVDTWTLADGDVILLGSWRLTHRDLGSRQPGAARPPRRKEIATWLK
jgi:hypothetical protein